MKYLWLIVAIFLYRAFNAIFVKTFFDPDEYWQSLEVAHASVFSTGYLTWEWSAKIRGFAHPFLFSCVYHIIRYLKLDHTEMIIIAPKLFQAVFSTIHDIFTFRLANKLYSRNVGRCAIAVSLISWFNFYFMSRTYSNSMETAFTSIAFFYWPWKPMHSQNSYRLRIALFWASIACIIRPTSAITWMFLGIRFVIQNPAYRITMILNTAIIMISAVSISILIDYHFYKEWTFVPWNFIKFNILSGISSFYGTNQWHWYLSQGIPVILFTFTPFAILGLDSNFRSVIFWNIFVQSLLPHKEFRFLGPLLPLLHVSAAKSLSKIKFNRSIWLFLLLTHASLGIYLSRVHQSGVIDVMHYLRNESQKGHVSSIFFLTPCHATPYHAYIHYPVPMDFLLCDPPWRKEDKYVDETEEFFKNPKKFIKQLNRPLGSHVVMFESLNLRLPNYHLCARFFNSHFIDSIKKEGDVLVYCNNSMIMG